MSLKLKLTGFILSLLFAVTHTTLGQSITVVDKSTRNPIAEASIYINEVLIGKTNEKGKLTLPEGMSIYANQLVDLHIYASSYQSQLLQKKLTNDVNVSLYPSIITIQEVTVSASRFEDSSLQSPQNIQKIDQRDIEVLNQGSTADLMAQSGKVFVQKSQLGGGSVVIRGFEANRVLMVVDGVRMNNAIYRSGHLQNIITMDQNSLDHLEVFYGPGSVQYGSDAIGGVLSFYTKKPKISETPKLSGAAFVRGNTASLSRANSNLVDQLGESSGHLELNYGTRRVAVFGGFTYSKFNDSRQGDIGNPYYDKVWKRNQYVVTENGVDKIVSNSDPNLQVGSGYSQYDGILKVLFAPTKKVKHTLNFQYSNSSNVNRYDRLTDIRAGSLRFAEWYYGPQQRLMASYQLELDSASIYDKASITVAYQNIVESRHNRDFGKDIRNDRTETVNMVTINIDMAKRLNRRLGMRYGIEVWYNDVNSRADGTSIKTDAKTAISTRYPDGSNSYTSGAAYINFEYKILPALTAQLGGRYSVIQTKSTFGQNSFYKLNSLVIDNTFSATNGSFGMVYTPQGDWKISGLVSTGFRAPNIDDSGKFFDSQSGATVMVPNANLKPEYVSNYEVTIQKTFNKQYRFTANVYYMNFTDIIQAGSDKFNGQDSILYDGKLSKVVSNQNYNRANVYGAYFGIDAQLNNQLSFSQTLTFTKGIIKVEADNTEVPLDHIPPTFGKSMFTYTAAKVRVDFYALYNGWKRIEDFNPNGEDNQRYATPLGMPAWYTLNVRATYFMNKNTSVQLGVENITDQNYRFFSSGISSPGRFVSLTLRAKF